MSDRKRKPYPRLKRIPYSGSTDSRIVLANDEDIGRISGKHDKTACIAYPDGLAKQIVGSINGRERLLNEVDELRQELARRRAKKGQLKPIDLTAISRHSDILFTHIRLEDYDLRETLTREEDGARHIDNWLEFGECRLQNEGDRTLGFIGGRMRSGITDFEHDTPYVVRVPIIGLKFECMDNHVFHYTAYIVPEPDDIRIYDPSFVPEEVEDSWHCDDEHCDEHLMLPDGSFTPPQYELAHVVAGKRINITIGPRWDVIEKDKEGS